VTSTDPITDATSIAINSKISAIFSVGMDPSTITSENFTLQQGSTDVSGAVGYTGATATATFTPSSVLAAGTEYTATITTGAKDVDGKPLAKDYIWSFTTGGTLDLTKPTVTLTDPANSAIGVIRNKLIVITFSEPMDQATINSLTYTLKQGSTSVPGTVTYTGTKATFTPASNLEYSKIYTGTITTGAKDLAGNALAGNNTFSFTTGDAPDIIAPVVNSNDPLSDVTGVALDKVVALTFSEAMNTSTINATTFTLMQGTTPVSGAITNTGTTFRFTPTAPLTAGLLYTATITTGATDVAGNALAASTVWSFTTATATSGGLGVDLKTAGDFVILAKTAISTTGTTAITGDIGVSPIDATAITGFGLVMDGTNTFSTSVPLTLVTGKVYAANYADPTPAKMTTAVSAMEAAYTDAAGRIATSAATTNVGGGTLTGLTLTPGVYEWGTAVTIPTDLTLSGNETDVWIFKVAGTLDMAAGKKVILTGGALPQNIFWQVTDMVTLGTTSHFEGNILSMTGITLITGATMNGRALAQTAVILDASTVTKP